MITEELNQNESVQVARDAPVDREILMVTLGLFGFQFGNDNVDVQGALFLGNGLEGTAHADALGGAGNNVYEQRDLFIRWKFGNPLSAGEPVGVESLPQIYPFDSPGMEIIWHQDQTLTLTAGENNIADSQSRVYAEILWNEL